MHWLLCPVLENLEMIGENGRKQGHRPWLIFLLWWGSAHILFSYSLVAGSLSEYRLPFYFVFTAIHFLCGILLSSKLIQTGDALYTTLGASLLVFMFLLILTSLFFLPRSGLPYLLFAVGVGMYIAMVVLLCWRKHGENGPN
jgi:hypothetical protein